MNIIQVKNKDVKFIDENTLKEWYVEFNKLYFDDMLEKNPDIQIVNKNVNYFGLCTYDKKQILMNANHLDNRYIIYIKNILIHEMIHMMQGNLGYAKGHGKSFLDKAKEINHQGWNIKVHVDEDELRFIKKIEEKCNIEDCVGLMSKSNTKYVVNLIKDILDYNNVEYDNNDIENRIINNDIDDLIDQINSVIDEDDNIPKSDWEEYIEWRQNKALWNVDKEGDKTSLNKCHANIVGFIDNFPKTKGKIKFNNVRNQVEWDGRQMTDADIHEVLKLITKYFINDFSSVRMVKDALDSVAFSNKFNPWINYFNNLEYKDDGVDYIEYSIKNVLCCEEQDKYYDLYYETLKIFYLATMHRICQKEKGLPVKYDTVTTFCGRNGGSGKTTFFERLFDIDNDGNTYCYVIDSESFKPSDKEFLEKSHQCVCLLLDELSMRRAVVTSVKGYITKRSDKFRKSYGYVNEDHVRGFTITASSNNDDILKDYTTDNERRWAIIKISENTKNYENVNKAFDNGFRDKLWAFIKNIYESEEPKLYMTDDRLIELESDIQRNYKASNNEDYNTIIDDLLERDYGFYDDVNIDVDAIVAQYKYNNSHEWCVKHNEEYNAKFSKSLSNEYTMRPDDRVIKFWGKIDKIPKTSLYRILSALRLEYTSKSLAAEMRYSKRWNGWDNKPCNIGGKAVKAYWRVDKENIYKFDPKTCENDDKYIKESKLPF